MLSSNFSFHNDFFVLCWLFDLLIIYKQLCRFSHVELVLFFGLLNFLSLATFLDLLALADCY